MILTNILPLIKTTEKANLSGDTDIQILLLDVTYIYFLHCVQCSPPSPFCTSEYLMEKFMNKVNYSKQSTAFCLELGRIKLLLDKLENPDRALRIIHIAGTNGKGSVGSFIETGLIAIGEKCGRFQSPHLFSVEDSVTINGEPIKKSSLEYYVRKLRPYAEEVAAELGIAPSPFELLFAAVLLYFKRKKCTAVILECGMGGAGDATNAITGAEVGIFTTMALDHTEYLGDTLSKIAENKCGILREGMRVYSAPQAPEAKRIIEKKCRAFGCVPDFVSGFQFCSMDGMNSIVNIAGEKTRLSLAGLFQNINAALAAEVLKKEFGIDDTALKTAVSNAKNRARLEEIGRGVYFDGAHNPSGVQSLVETINTAGIDGKLIFAVGFMADKDISACLDCLKQLKNQNFEIYATKVHSNPRSASAEDIARLAKAKGIEAQCFKSIADAVREARQNADTVFAVGSLYMYKELMR